MVSKKFAVLDGMRGLAALLVLTRHTEAYWAAPWLSHNHSYLAVDLFFVLSGFVISHAYAQQLGAGRLSAGRFMLIRWIRLWPLHALGAALGAALVVARDVHAPGAWVLPLVLMLLFLPSRMPEAGDGLFALNPPGWSLFYEMAVNLAYALTHRWLTNRVLVAVLVVSGAGLVATGLYNGSLDVGFTWSMRSLAGGTLRAVFGIFLGIGLHRLYLARQRRAGTAPGPWALCAAVTALLLVPHIEGLGSTVDLLAVFVVFPVCVYLGAQASVGASSVKLFALLGLLSYPVYVLHVPLGEWLEGVVAVPLAPYAPLAGVLFAAGLVALAWALDRWFDQPVRRFLTRVTAARQAPRPG
ncbi:acyltransferase family protein [Variovorax sp. N23]|uniref:acyltransferase family protein n=1 Tax=Variovorax sp. N23 TaxID=2980555 RepID=UPI0021C9378B|nr:acyltransferase [Variovorax sp. N23]MCU4122082.1 acyltransferase [Variovorax sp. N23]